jgi:hypothetical protein
MSFDGRAASSSGCAIRPRGREIGSTGYVGRTPNSSPTGLYVMATAEHREPCESRGSCTVLGAPGGEIPPGDSTHPAIELSMVRARGKAPELHGPIDERGSDAMDGALAFGFISKPPRLSAIKSCPIICAQKRSMATRTTAAALLKSSFPMIGERKIGEISTQMKKNCVQKRLG